MLWNLAASTTSPPRRGWSHLPVLWVLGGCASFLAVVLSQIPATDAERGAAPAPVDVSNMEQSIIALAVSPDGATAVAGELNGTVTWWNVQTGALQGRLNTESVIASVAFSPDSSRTFIGVSHGGLMCIDHRAPESESQVWAGHLGEVRLIRFSRDGCWMMSAGSDQLCASLTKDPGDVPAVLLRDATTGEVVRRLTGPVSTVWSGCFSPDGRWLIVGEDDGGVWRWDLAAGDAVGRRIGRMEGVPLLIESLGASLFLVSRAGELQRWNVDEAGSVRVAWQETVSPVTSIALAADERTLGIGHRNGVVEVWDLQSQRRRGAGKIHEKTVRSLAAWNDGRFMSGSWDGRVCTWHSQAPAPTSGARPRDLQPGPPGSLVTTDQATE